MQLCIQCKSVPRSRVQYRLFRPSYKIRVKLDRGSAGAAAPAAAGAGWGGGRGGLGRGGAGVQRGRAQRGHPAGMPPPGGVGARRIGTSVGAPSVARSPGYPSAVGWGERRAAAGRRPSAPRDCTQSCPPADRGVATACTPAYPHGRPPRRPRQPQPEAAPQSSEGRRRAIKRGAAARWRTRGSGHAAVAAHISSIDHGPGCELLPHSRGVAGLGRLYQLVANHVLLPCE